MDSMWDEAFANRSVHSLQDQEIYKDTNNPLGFDAEKYGQALWAIAYMTELANQRAGITNGSQVALVDLVTQIRAKGWEVAFTDNIGVTTANFYTDFANVLNANDKSSRLANLVTTNIGSTIVPQYNYSTLQVTGASATSNYGGNPVSAKRSVYFFNTDPGTVPTYNGTFWPYVKSSMTSTVTQEEGISALLNIQNNYVNIHSSTTSPRPVYQFVSDSDATVSGGSISGWAAINFDGKPVVSRTYINSSPVITTQASIAVNENQTAVTTLSAIDNDLNESLFFTLSGVDANSFNLSNAGVLSFITAPDYEIKNQYSLTISVNDGEEISSQALTINIQDVNDLPNIEGLASSIGYLENSGLDVLTVPASDQDAGTNLNFSLGGVDASALSISNLGVITFNNPPNFETQSSYNLTISVSDGLETVSQPLVINIQNTNSPPTINNLETILSFDENSTLPVVTVNATDPDAGASLSYSLSGADAAAFSISNAGVVTFNSPPDYETKNTYNITVIASDGIESSNQATAILIQDTNDPPIINGLISPISFTENSVANVVTVNATDPDAGASLSYSLSGADAAALSISNAGVVTFNSPPDYETKNTYNITVSVTDGVETVSQAVTINVQNSTSEPLSFNGLANEFSYLENTSVDLVDVGALTAGDDEACLILTFSLSGPDANEFTISNSTACNAPNNGVINFISMPNYEVKNTYNITVTATDGSESISQNLIINIQDLNPEPAVITNMISSSSNYQISFPENSSGNVFDVNTSNTIGLSFSLTGTDAAALTIANDGIIRFKTPPNYELKSEYIFTVSVTDGTNTDSKGVRVEIQNVAEDVNLNISGNNNYYENDTVAVPVTVTASDDDGDPITFSLSGADAAALSISNAGVLLSIHLQTMRSNLLILSYHSAIRRSTETITILLIS